MTSKYSLWCLVVTISFEGITHSATCSGTEETAANDQNIYFYGLALDPPILPGQYVLIPGASDSRNWWEDPLAPSAEEPNWISTHSDPSSETEDDTIEVQ